ncbi:MAG: TIGR02147 family protein [Bdellovibrionaceae bacterium]|nr:TIGR02147 family protein [Pseudobdellovibrionaceae bacterium]MBX3034412.1 TIGR02147 family protein [Pseudobdellovibrionaceae bacterium]
MQRISIYHHEDYKKYVTEWVENQPRQGFGEYRRISQALNVSTTMISQVFKGDKHLSLELAAELCEYLQLDEQEAEYFLLLVEANRAGSMKLRKRFEKQIKVRQNHAKKLENRIKNVHELTSDQKSIYYSSWLYSGVRMLSDLESFNDSAVIADHLRLPRPQIQKVLDFLLQHGLVVSEKNRLKLGPTRIYLSTSSHLANKQHQNWRLHAMNKMVQPDDDNFFYTVPMSLSREVADWIRRELPEFVEKVNAKVTPSKSEVVRCLSIDYFEF